MDQKNAPMPLTTTTHRAVAGARTALRRLGLAVCVANAGGALAVAATPTLSLARVFTSNSVLQRGPACPVFGKDEPGTPITVTFAGQTCHTTTDSAGHWRVNLSPLGVSPSPQELTVRGNGSLTLTNILVGDVWLVSGQSNAHFPLKSAAGAQAAIASATNRLIRCLPLAGPEPQAGVWSAAQLRRLNPKESFRGEWKASDPANVAEVSAIGYYFAWHLQTNRNVPVGLIDCTVGGTPALSWMPTEAIAANPRLRAMADNFLASDMVAPFAKTRLLQNLKAWDLAGRPAPMPEHPYKPGACWRNGLATLAPYALRGILWYQGETDADFYDPFDYDLMSRWHTDTFKALVAAWRSAWENASLPVYFVQLPQMNRPSWPWFRESQMKCSTVVSNTAMAVAFEFGEPGNVHPVRKQPVGNRLALIARARSYGEAVAWSGPRLRSWHIEGGRMLLDFDHAASGLMANDSQPLRWFQIAGTNRQFVTATATISNQSLLVSAPEVVAPVAVRYAWVPFGSVNFFNRAGLPASPFRTDGWITTHHPVRVACIGDSITFGATLGDTNRNYPAQLQALLGPEYAVRNFGKSGCTVARDAYKDWRRGYILQPEHTNALAFHPDVVICNLGINDVSAFADACRTNLVRDYREIIAAYRALPSAPRFILWHPLAPLFPGQTYYGQPVVTNVNHLIRQAAELSAVETLDLFTPLTGHPEWFPDHIHPEAAGAQRIAEVVFRHFRQMEAAQTVDGGPK
jgi:sialate O-acetylesterase